MQALVLGNGGTVTIPAVIKSVGTSLGLGATQLVGELDSNGKLRFPSTVYTPDFTGYTMPCRSYELAYQFYGSENKCGGNLVFTDLTSLCGGFNTEGAYAGNGYFLYYTFSSNTSITSVSFPALVTIEAYSYYSMYYTFRYCSYLTSVSFPELTTVDSDSSQYLFGYAFQGCNRLTTINFPKLVTYRVYNAILYYTFYQCTGLTTVEFPELTTVELVTTSSSGYIFYNTFYGCTSLTTARFPKLSTITVVANSTSVFYRTFQNCTALANVYFNSDISWSSVLTNPFNQMLYGCSNVTVHFKSSMQSAISALSSAIAGFGGSDTVILYDL